jgi:hypothetical protein
MRGRIIIALILAATASQGGWWAWNVPRGGGATTYTPIGWDKSLVWLKFDSNAKSNITDYSVIGTNAFDMTAPATSGVWSASSGWTMNMGGGQEGFAQRGMAALGSGLTNWTIAMVCTPLAQVDYAGWFFIRTGGGGVNGLVNWVGANKRWAVYEASVDPLYSPIGSYSLSNQVSVIVTRNSTNLVVYTNGVQCSIANDTTALGTWSPAYKWNIGRDSSNPGREFKGRIYDVYFTAVGFSAADASNHNANCRKPTP